MSPLMQISTWLTRMPTHLVSAVTYSTGALGAILVGIAMSAAVSVWALTLATSAEASWALASASRALDSASRALVSAAWSFCALSLASACWRVLILSYSVCVIAPFDFRRSSRAFVVSSARACDDPTIKAEKAHAAHNRAIVVWRLLLIDPPNIKRGRKLRTRDVAKAQRPRDSFRQRVTARENTRKFKSPLPNPGFRWRCQRTPALTSRSLEAQDD